MSIKTKEKIALVFGSTGLIGSHLTQMLLNDDRYSEVKVFVRREISIVHPKLKIILHDMENIGEIAHEIKGDDLFCCLGTTMKKAGSKAAFEKVDLHLPVDIAKIASANGVNKFLVVSSIGANKNGWGFYLKTKAKMEEGVRSFHFGQVSILRPSLLLGERKDFRRGEEIGKILANVTGFLYKGPLAKYKPIKAKVVAKAMVHLANTVSGTIVYESDRISGMA